MGVSRDNLSQLFRTFFTLDQLFRTVSRGPPGPLGSVLRKFSESSQKVPGKRRREKAGEGWRRLESVGESSRKLLRNCSLCECA